MSTKGQTEDAVSHAFVLGNRGSGKTCFLSGLYEYGRAHQDGGVTVTTTDEVAAQFLQELHELRKKGIWPPATTGTTYVPLRIVDDKKGLRCAIELHTLDYPGEDLKRSLFKLDPDARSTVEQGMKRANTLIILVDPQRDIDLGIGMLVDVHELQNRQDVLLKTVNEMASARISRSSKNDVALPQIILIVTKSDLLPAELAAGSSLKSILFDRNSAFVQKLSTIAEAKHLTVRSISAFGETSDKDTPPAIASPSGYRALIEQLSCWRSMRVNAKRNRLIGAAVLVAAIVAILLIVSRSRVSKEAIVSIRNESLENLAGLIRTDWPKEHEWADWQRDEVERRLAIERQDIRAFFGQAGSQDADSMKILRERQECLVEFPGNSNRRTDKELLDEIVQRWSAVLWDLAQANRANPKKFKELLTNYISTFPNGEFVVRALEELKNEKLRQFVFERQAIESVRLNGASDLREIANRIDSVVGAYPDLLQENRINATELKMASDFARKLASEMFFQLRIEGVKFDESKGDRDHHVKLLTPDAESIQSDCEEEVHESTHDLQYEPSTDTNGWYKIQLWDVDGGLGDFSGLELMAEKAMSLYTLIGLMDNEWTILLDDYVDGKNIFGSTIDYWKGTNAVVKGRVLQRAGGAEWQAVSPEEVRAFNKFITGRHGWRNK